jgi:hypothetical protein
MIIFSRNAKHVIIFLQWTLVELVVQSDFPAESRLNIEDVCAAIHIRHSSIFQVGKSIPYTGCTNVSLGSMARRLLIAFVDYCYC